MVNLKLIIPIIVVAVVVVAVVLLLFVPGMGGGQGQTTTPTTTPTNTTIQETGPATRTTRQTRYNIYVDGKIRDPTPTERSQGILKVIEFDYKISVVGTVQIKKIVMEVDNENITLKEYVTPITVSNNPGYRIPLKYEIKTQSELNKWQRIRIVTIYTYLVVEGKEKVEPKTVVLTPEEITITRPITFV